MKRMALVCLAIAVLLAAACTETKPAIIGNPNPKGHVVQEANPAKLKVLFGRYQDTFVVIEVEFASRLHSSPLDGYQAVLARHEYGNVYILVRDGIYTDVLDSLKRDQKMQVYGIVSSAKGAADKESKIAILVTE